MNLGICNVSIAPVRAEATDSAEMVTQLLFGEKVEILETQKKWLKIKADYDGYEGWVDPKQIASITESFFLQNQQQYTSELFNLIVGKEGPLTLPIGAHLILNSQRQMSWGNYQYGIHCETIIPNEEPQRKNIEATVKQYINVPYLWGGKSNFGIDCSGLVQQVYKLNGLYLPRDAAQQAEIGEMLGFVEEANTGDLAFFDNNDGKIIHVGIILNQNQIIHAHGRVRIDPIDSTGIFNTDTQKYSHQLRFIKRIINP